MGLEGAENSIATAGAQTGETGAAPGGDGAPSGAVSGVDAESRAKREANAQRQREARALKKLDRAEKARKKLERLQRAGATSPAPTPAPEAPAQLATAEPAAQLDGWPSPEAQAACMPSSLALLGQARNALAPTRYGEALQPQTFELQQADGSTKKVHVDPVKDTLAPSLAAVLAGSGAKMTPGQMLLTGLTMTLGPVAFFHAVELGMQWYERRQQRAARVAPAPRPVVEPTPTPPAGQAFELPKPARPRGPASADLDFKRESA